MEAVKAAEDMIRTERHDLRHRLQTAAELVSRGERESALEFLDSAQERLNERKAVRWCRPPVLDAVFSSYFDQAQNQGIPVEARISLPDTLPVDEGELAIVLANALENAIHACQSLPAGARKISCKVIARPSLMIEIANPVAGAVEFDSQGLPAAAGEGHGLGTRSIAAFCQKHGFLYHFAAKGGWFRLRLVL